MPERRISSLKPALLIFLSACFLSAGVTDPPGSERGYPQDFFRMPIDRKVLLSGSFGELRPNHFHAGIDIKAKNYSAGETVVAAAPGYISRVKVQANGYGNAIYMAHPNGYTTVYAHLDGFAPEIATYIKQMQYAQKSFEVDLYPESSRFTYKQGELIGYLGNSGSSTAPHLHFEIRKTAGQVPVNPMLFGLPVEDNVAPAIHGLKSYCLNDKYEPVSEDQHRLKYMGNNSYILYDTLYLEGWRAAFALKAYDRMTGAHNLNGIYRLDMYVDDDLQYRFTMEEFPFSETRFLNAHIDYSEKARGKGYWNRCYQLPGNKLSIYNTANEEGVIKLYTAKARKITCHIYDINDNVTTLEFWVKRKDRILEPEAKIFHKVAEPFEPINIESAGLSASFRTGTFYENTYLEFTTDTTDIASNLTPVYRIEPWDAALHKYFDLAIAFGPIDKKYLSKAFIAHTSRNGSWSSLGGAVSGNTIRTQARDLGSFTVRLDTVAPVIRPLSFSQNMSGYRTMSFRITDNIAARGKARDLQYRATIDGEWILMEYDMKRDRITHVFDERTAPGEHEFILEVWDDRNNVATFSRKFTR